MTDELEGRIQSNIREALGRERDLAMFRNTVGEYHERRGKRARHIKYGLGPGSADIVCILRIDRNVPIGAWFCVEVKRPGEEPEPDQVQWAAMMREHGAWVCCCHSVAEAWGQLRQARDWFAPREN